MIGIGVAASGAIASALFGALWADGVASIAIGIILIACSWVMAEATRSLVAGETVAPSELEDIQKALQNSTDRLPNH